MLQLSLHGCSFAGKKSGRTEALCSSSSSFASARIDIRSVPRGHAGSGCSRGRRLHGVAVRADGEAIVNVPGSGNGKDGQPASLSYGGDNSQKASNPDEKSPGGLVGSQPRWVGETPPQGNYPRVPPPPMERPLILSYKEVAPAALARVAPPPPINSDDVTMARHRLLSQGNNAIRQVYGHGQVNVGDVLLGVEEPRQLQAQARNGAEASTSGQQPTGIQPAGQDTKTSALANQLAVLLSEKAQIEVSGQLNRVRDKMTSRVSKANSYSRHLELSLRQRDKAISEAHALLLVLAKEIDLMREMAADGAHEAPYIVDRSLVTEKFVTLRERAKSLRTKLDDATTTVDSQRVRSVRIEWTGYAEDVRVMGSFDNWTRGLPLAREGLDDAQGGLSLYSVDLSLRPGYYEMKLMCDGKWFEIVGLPVDDSARRNSIVHVK